MNIHAWVPISLNYVINVELNCTLPTQLIPLLSLCTLSCRQTSRSTLPNWIINFPIAELYCPMAFRDSVSSVAPDEMPVAAEHLHHSTELA